MMCGQSDVAKRADGEYVCTLCGAKLGKDFAARVLLMTGKRVPDKPR